MFDQEFLLKHQLLIKSYLSDIELSQELNKLVKCPYLVFDPCEEKIDNTLFHLVPIELMIKYCFVPICKYGGYLWLAIADPLDIVVQDLLGLYFDCPLSFIAAIDTKIMNVIEKLNNSQKIMDEVGASFRIQVIKGEEESNFDLDYFVDKDQAPIIRLVDTIIFNALQQRASDIHMETTVDSFHIRYRIDGLLHLSIDLINKYFAPAIVSRIKVMSELDIAENRRPQDGRFKLKVRGKIIDFRVSIMPTIHGEDVVVRILDKINFSENNRVFNLDSLGFSSSEIHQLRQISKKPYGMFLVTGPTGSGKSTTLYAIVNEILNSENKFITIEDPVEYQLNDVTQIPVNEQKGLTFAVGLRSILRHDPDKIMVGEIRDSETAQIAVQSALTGHVLFSTIHANYALDVFNRFQHMGVEVSNFISALNCIVSQRLVRVLCVKCKRPIDQLSEVDLVTNGLDYTWLRSATLFERVGCQECNGNGFYGRQAIMELVRINNDIRELIASKVAIREAISLAKLTGIRTLRRSAIEKVRQGLTTFTEINRVTSSDDINLV